MLLMSPKFKYRRVPIPSHLDTYQMKDLLSRPRASGTCIATIYFSSKTPSWMQRIMLTNKEVSSLLVLTVTSNHLLTKHYIFCQSPQSQCNSSGRLEVNPRSWTASTRPYPHLNSSATVHTWPSSQPGLGVTQIKTLKLLWMKLKGGLMYVTSSELCEQNPYISLLFWAYSL